MGKISVAIITYNEAKNITRCIQSVKKIADEIVVVDSFSQDETCEIAEKLGARVIKQAFLGFVEQKNFALNQCRLDYVLSLDADEAVDEELECSLLALKASPDKMAYTMNRMTYYGGRWVRYCGWYPDTKLRFAKRSAVRWQGTNPHDQLIPIESMPSYKLSGNILHYSYTSVSDHITQTNKFTSIMAKEYHKSGRRTSMFTVVTRPMFSFLRDFIWHRGFLDGNVGFVICCINSLSSLLKYFKLYELQKGRSID